MGESKLHAENHRLEKVLALVAVVMGFAQKRGIDPVQLVDGLDLRDWLMFAKVAGKNPPSEISKALVRATIREAVEKIAAGETVLPHDGDCEGFCDIEQMKPHRYGEHSSDTNPRCAGWLCVEHELPAATPINQARAAPQAEA